MAEKNKSSILKLAILSIAATIAIIILGFICLVWNFNRWPFELKKLDSFNNATTIQEVEKTLGKPKSVYEKTNAEGEIYQQWVYSAPGSWPIVYINFNSNGTYESHDCDY